MTNFFTKNSKEPIFGLEKFFQKIQLSHTTWLEFSNTMTNLRET